MAKEQWKEPILELACQHVTATEKLKPSAITKTKTKAVRIYLLKFDRLTF